MVINSKMQLRSKAVGIIVSYFLYDMVFVMEHSWNSKYSLEK